MANTKTRYRLYLAMHPDCVGYAHTETAAREAWTRVMSGRPHYVGTASGCVDALTAYQRAAGEGVFVGRCAVRASDGVEVVWRDVEDEANEIYAAREYRVYCRSRRERSA